MNSIAVGIAIALAASAAEARPLVAAYYSASGSATAAAAVPAESLDILLYAFVTLCGAHPDPDAERARTCAGRSPSELALSADAAKRAEFDAVAGLKRRNPALRLIASVGGWGMPLFPATVANPKRRAAFVASAVALLRAHPAIDGIDLDWEYPGGGDEARRALEGGALARERADFARLVVELRAALDAISREAGRPALLTAAVAGYERRVAAIDWATVAPRLDHVFVMTYDFTSEREFMRRGDFSGGGGSAGHHANLRAGAATGGLGADAAIATLRRAGVPPAKMLLGVPFYGREWAGASIGRAGIGGGRFVGTPAYRDIVGRGGLADGYDARADAAYRSDRAGRFISLATPRSIRAASCLADEARLAGLFAWEITQDDGTLLAAMRRGCD